MPSTTVIDGTTITTFEDGSTIESYSRLWKLTT